MTTRTKIALRCFDERFIVNTYLMKRSKPELLRTECADPVAREASKNRHEFLLAKGSTLYRFDSYIIVLIKPEWSTPEFVDQVTFLVRHPIKALRQFFLVKQRVRSLNAQLSRSIRVLHHAVKSFLEQTSEHLDGRMLNKPEALTFFRRMLNPDPLKAGVVTLGRDGDVDYVAVDSELECYRDHLRLDNYFVKTLTLKQLPSHSFANMFADLSKLKGDLVFVSEWSAINPAKAVADVRSKRRHWHSTKSSLFSQMSSERPYERELLFDDSKEALVKDLGDCLGAIEMQGVQLGNFSFTVLILSSSLEEGERAAAEVMKVFGVHDGALNEERYNGLNAFLAALPGGHPYNLRKCIVTDENYADMVSWFTPAEGERRNTFLNADSLVALETEDQTLFDLNLHVQDVGHAAIFGPTGTGKTFLLNVLLTHAQQYDPRTFIFDVGGSYRWLTEVCGGSYVSFRPDARPFAINPFCLDPTAGNLEFLFSFVKVLIESGGHRITDSEDRDLFEAIRSLYVLDPDQRRLLTLAGTVPRKLGIHLTRWTEGEQYGQWFDHSTDTVWFARFQCVDFEGMERLGAVLEPLLFYLLHRANDVIYDPALSTVFKLAVVDEAWLFFKHRVTSDYITTALRTWRKKNAAMILSTQSLRDLAGAETMRPAIESCPTKLLLANPNLDSAFYGEVLQLTPTEQAKVRGLAPKRQLLLKREGLSKVLNLHIDPKSFWLFTTNPYEAKRRQELVNQVGLAAALEILKGESR